MPFFCGGPGLTVNQEEDEMIRDHLCAQQDSSIDLAALGPWVEGGKRVEAFPQECLTRAKGI